MTGIKVPTGVVGGTIVATNGTLPYTGAMLTMWVIIGVALVLAGVAIRVFGRNKTDVAT